jgi:hypothetical protein
MASSHANGVQLFCPAFAAVKLSSTLMVQRPQVGHSVLLIALFTLAGSCL